MGIKLSLAFFITVLAGTVSAATDRNHPELAPDDGEWHLWLFSPYVDSSTDHDSMFPSFYCFKNIGNIGTQTKYDWYAYQYASPQDTVGYGYQEGDQLFFHAEFPEKKWPSGTSNPPSLLSFHGQLIGGEKLDIFQLDRVQVVKSGFAEILAWNPKDIYQDTFSGNFDMHYFGNNCDDKNVKSLLSELQFDYNLERAFAFLNQGK